MRLAITSVLVCCIAGSAAAQEQECSKILDIKRPLRITFEETRAVIERTGEVKKQIQERLNRIDRSTSPRQNEVFGQDGSRTGVIYSWHWRPTHAVFDASKGQRRVHWKYSDEVESNQLAEKRDFERAYTTETYEGEESKEAKHEGFVSLYRFTKESNVSVESCVYKTLSYEVKTYNFRANGPPSITRGVIDYSPELNASVFFSNEIYDNGKMIVSMESRIKTIIAEEPFSSKAKARR